MKTVDLISNVHGYPGGIDLTFECNNNCVFCFNNYKRGRPCMPLEEAKQKADEIRAQGKKIVRLCGSEPTLYPFLEDLAAHIFAAGGKFALSTNCRRFADASLALRLKNLGLTSVYTSVHGHTPELLESITGAPGSFNEIMTGIQNLISAGVAVETNTTICSLNYPQLPQIARFICGRFPKIFRSRFSYLYLKNNENLKHLLVPLDEARLHLEAALDIIREAGKDYLVEKGPRCLAPHYENFFKAESFVSEINQKPEVCGNCQYANSPGCVGVSAQYLERFSQRGIVPFPRMVAKNG